MSESEFGKVLEREGWRAGLFALNLAFYRLQDNPQGRGAEPFAYDSTEGHIMLVFRGCAIRCEDEHQVLRIVASMEGTDRWRTDEPPMDEVVDVMWRSPELGWVQAQAITRDGEVFLSTVIPVDICNVKEAKWRPYSPANWEVK